MKIALKLALCTAACAALLVAVTPAQALRIAAPAPGYIVAQAHTIVVGKVESIEEKTVAAKQFPDATEKVEYQIAVIKIQDPILGAKGLTHIRVGFLPAPMGGPGPIRPGRLPAVSFTKDQEVLVYLQPHADGSFMVAQQYFDVVNKEGNPNFDKQVEETKKFVKILSNPKESLKADKQEDRYAAAALLITQYRNAAGQGAQPKTEAVDAEISKLILTALAEADWKNAPVTPGTFRMSTLVTFQQLGVTEKDGFNPPMMEIKGQPNKVPDYAKLPDYAKQWCKDNAGKYKIQRFVVEEKKEKSDK